MTRALRGLVSVTTTILPEKEFQSRNLRDTLLNRKEAIEARPKTD